MFDARTEERNTRRRRLLARVVARCGEGVTNVNEKVEGGVRRGTNFFSLLLGREGGGEN